jgi:hypothetical protein
MLSSRAARRCHRPAYLDKPRQLVSKMLRLSTKPGPLDMSTLQSLPPKVRAHWFFWIAPIVIAINCFVALRARDEVDRLIEAGLLFDLAILLPFLYWLCYRGRGKQAVIRAAALACLGIWAATKLVLPAEQELLHYVAPLRYVGLAVLVMVEIAIVMAVYRAVFRGGSAADAAAQAQKAADMPAWAAKLIAYEATLWRRVWLFFTNLFKRR